MTTTKTRIAVLLLAALMAVGTAAAGSAMDPIVHDAHAAKAGDVE